MSQSYQASIGQCAKGLVLANQNAEIPGGFPHKLVVEVRSVSDLLQSQPAPLPDKVKHEVAQSAAATCANIPPWLSGLLLHDINYSLEFLKLLNKSPFRMFFGYAVHQPFCLVDKSG